MSQSRDKRGQSRGGKNSNWKNKIKCYNCQNMAHFVSKCKHKKNENDEANMVSDEQSCDCLLLAVRSCLDSWILDSGTSFHTIVNREMFKNYTAGTFHKLYLADGEAQEIVAIGDVNIRVPNGSV